MFSCALDYFSMCELSLVFWYLFEASENSYVSPQYVIACCFLKNFTSPYSKLKYYKKKIIIDWPTWKAKNLGPSFTSRNK